MFNKKACIVPWLHLTVNPNHKYKVCCHSDKPLNINASETSMEEALNSNLMESIREKFINSEWPEECNICKLTEQNGMRSQREIYNKTFKQFIDSFDNIPKLQSVDLKFSNECNLSCRMCSTTSSSKVNETIIDLKEKNIELPTHWQGSTIWQDDKANLPTSLDQELKSLDLFKFKATGGEPTMQKRWLKLIDHYVDTQKCKHIILDFTTNGTKFNNNLLEKIKQFKKVRIRVSIDGYGETYNYIRYPFNWNMLEKRLNQLYEYVSLNNNISIGISVLGQVYNIFNIGELWQFYDQINNKYNLSFDRSTFFIDYFLRPTKSEYNVNYLPYDLVENAYFKFKKEVNYTPLIQDFENYLRICYNTKEEKHSEIKYSTAILDKHRDQSYKILHPQIVSYLNA
tara:strand:+ start:2000 stop:3196 length:1197 start_codon:yes stop_codon:yes gene_type:complete